MGSKSPRERTGVKSKKKVKELFFLFFVEATSKDWQMKHVLRISLPLNRKKKRIKKEVTNIFNPIERVSVL
jgi:hypothetical protein